MKSIINHHPLTIILTGCAGFIGSHLLDRLLLEKHRVIGVDDFNDYYDPKLKEKNVSEHLTNPNFTLKRKDICSLSVNDLPSSIIHYPLSIIHLAARAGVRASIQQPLLYEKVNVEGTLHLLELAKSLRVKSFIFGSSSSVYGNNTPAPFREDSPCDQPISPYAASKRAAELLCYTYHHLYKIPITILRFFTAYGPRNRPDMAAYRFTDSITKGKPINAYGNETSRDYTYISDIVDGIVAASKLTSGFQIINLGNSSPVTLGEFISSIERILKKKAKVVQRPLPPGDVRHTYADVTLAKTLLGWSPKTPLESGLKKLWRWYQATHR